MFLISYLVASVGLLYIVQFCYYCKYISEPEDEIKKEQVLEIKRGVVAIESSD